MNSAQQSREPMDMRYDVRVERTINSNNTPGDNTSKIETLHTARSNPNGYPTNHLSYDSRTTINSNNKYIDNRDYSRGQNSLTPQPTDSIIPKPVTFDNFGGSQFSNSRQIEIGREKGNDFSLRTQGNQKQRHDSYQLPWGPQSTDVSALNMRSTGSFGISQHSPMFQPSRCQEQTFPGMHYDYKETITKNSNNIVFDNRRFEDNRKDCREVITVNRSERDREQLAKLHETMEKEKKEHESFMANFGNMTN